MVLAGLLVRVALWHPLEVVGPAPDDGYVRVSGAIHMHTTLSDGGGTPEELIAAGKAAGVDFIVITDHDNADAKPLEGYHDRLLVLVGAEVSTRQGHVLGLGIAKPTFCFSGDAWDALDDIRHLGGFAVIAHPIRPDPKDAVNWTAWDLPGPWGVEVINGHSQWLGASLGRRLLTGALMPVNAHYAFLRVAHRPDAMLKKWDELLQRRDVEGTVGPDAHSRVALSRKIAFRYPPYEPQLNGAQNHVLLDHPLVGEARKDGAAILEAVRQGHSYIAMDALAPGEGFEFVAEGAGRRATMGDTIPADPPPTLRVTGRMPAKARVRLFHDGAVVREGPSPLTIQGARPGVYRSEVSVPGWSMPWVISNPIYVFDDATRARRAAAGAWPAPTPAPPAHAVIDDFNGPTTFGAEFDPSSRMATPPIDPTGGVDGSAAARIAFRLGAPTPGHPYTWCALVSRQARDLSGDRGLVFSVRADGVYRFWVQVRDENPRSSDEQTEWWFASVRTSTAWQRVAIPFDRLFSLNAHTDGRVDLDKVRGLVFVLDQRAVPPGTEGTIWIDDLGVYQ
jgi:hypothetical protein